MQLADELPMLWCLGGDRLAAPRCTTLGLGVFGSQFHVYTVKGKHQTRN